MSNPNYNKQTSQGYPSSSKPGPKVPKGVHLPGSAKETWGPYPQKYPVVGKIKKGL